MKYEVVVGLEVHAELDTRTKIYCNCTTKFGAEPNTQCCPVCLGLPGAIPVLNKKVVEYAVKTGLATNCSITMLSKQDRKNYFYPDLPKAYQISQDDLPICTDGYLDIEVEGKTKRVGIHRIHIEEDAGKLIHSESNNDTLIDFNRAGVPLIEIVTAPDMHSSQEVKAFFEKLKTILEYTEVSDCKMQEGSLRADINLSVKPEGAKTLGTRTEMKNLNSTRAIVRAVEHESKRQIEQLEQGLLITQETRRWDDAKCESYPLRSKKEAHDYRFFAEPNLCSIIIDDAWLKRIRASIPELPDDKKVRFIKQYDLPEYDAAYITSSKPLADYFENAAKISKNPKAISNWIMGDVLNKLKEGGIQITGIPISAQRLTKLVDLIDSNIISSRIAKQVFEIMWDTNDEPDEIVEKYGLQVLSDSDTIKRIVNEVISENPKAVDDIKSGKKRSIGFLVGQVMRKTDGKADPRIVNQLLSEATQ